MFESPLFDGSLLDDRGSSLCLTYLQRAKFESIGAFKTNKAEFSVLAFVCIHTNDSENQCHYFS